MVCKDLVSVKNQMQLNFSRTSAKYTLWMYGLTYICRSRDSVGVKKNTSTAILEVGTTLTVRTVLARHY